MYRQTQVYNYTHNYGYTYSLFIVGIQFRVARM